MANALDLVGERWTMLIVRDLLFGALRFTDLRDGLPGLAPNLLSDRLRLLTTAGLVEQVELPPPAARSAYALTRRGRELGPVVHELARFGVADWRDPDRHPPQPRLMRGALLALMSPERLGPPTWTARIDLADASVGIEARAPAETGHQLDRLRLSMAEGRPAPGVGGPDAVVATTLGTLLALRRGSLTVEEAERAGRLEAVGPNRVITQLARLFGWQ